MFTDPGKERAIIGCVIAETFHILPSYPPPEVFTEDCRRLVYQAALGLLERKEHVCIESVNDRLKLTGNYRDVQKALHPVAWESWSTDTDTSVAYSQPSQKYCLDELLKCYHEREAHHIAGELHSGGITFAEAYTQMAELERLMHAGNGALNASGSPLLDFQTRTPNPEDCLLGNRFLCRGGGMLFVGPSGMGKSSASVQQDIEWCMGRVSFGIKPARPLKIVTIQAEDDEGDIHEMVAGVCQFLGLTEDEVKQYRSQCVTVPHKSTTGTAFIAFVRKVLEKHRPDILRINPLQAYIGADLKDAKVTAEFLRTGLNPLLEEFNCAVIIVHHTPKTNFRDTEEWKSSDWMYAGAGSADVTNWARAILIADPTDDPSVFKWIAAKRGKRIGWADDSGTPTIIRHFSHSTNGGIHWDDTNEASIPQPKKKGGSKVKHTEDQILEHMHLIEARPVGEIKRTTMENTGMSKSTFFDLWGKLKESGKILYAAGGYRKII